MKENYIIDFKPTEKDFEYIHEWLISTQSGFLNNISAIYNSFKNNSFVTLKEDSKTIGFLTFFQESNFKTVRIGFFEIKKDCRKQGMGKFFMKEFLNVIEKHGSFVVELYCAPEDSQHFWRKIGFEDKIFSKSSTKSIWLYKILNLKLNGKNESDYEKEKITIWKEYGIENFNKEFEIEVHKTTKLLYQPLIINGLNEWEIKWQKGEIEKINQVKRITKDGLDYGDFIIIEKSIFE